MKSVENVETAAWTETSTRWEQPAREYTLTWQHWLRTNPPAESRHIDFGSSWSHDITDERGHTHSASTWKMCHHHPHRSPYTSESLSSRVLFPTSPETPAHQRPELNWRREAVDYDGQSLLHWFREYVQGNFRVSENIWTELRTRRIVRKECRQTNLITGKLAEVEVCDRYVYDEELPPGVFEAPAGKPFVTPDTSDIMPEVWDTLPEEDRRNIQEVISLSDDAWLRSDAAAFAGAWEFRAVREVPREAEWRRRMLRHKEIWSRWSSEAIAATSQEFIPISIGRHTFKMARVKGKVLRVTVKLTANRHHPGTEWVGSSEFYVQRRAAGYRIVHWECPWAEILNATA